MLVDAYLRPINWVDGSSFSTEIVPSRHEYYIGSMQVTGIHPFFRVGTGGGGSAYKYSNYGLKGGAYLLRASFCPKFLSSIAPRVPPRRALAHVDTSLWGLFYSVRSYIWLSPLTIIGAIPFYFFSLTVLGVTIRSEVRIGLFYGQCGPFFLENRGFSLNKAN